MSNLKDDQVRRVLQRIVKAWESDDSEGLLSALHQARTVLGMKPASLKRTPPPSPSNGQTVEPPPVRMQPAAPASVRKGKETKATVKQNMASSLAEVTLIAKRIIETIGGDSPMLLSAVQGQCALERVPNDPELVAKALKAAQRG